MTRRDYQLLTDSMRSAFRTWTPDTREREVAIYALEDMILTVADALAQDNKAFDKDKFINDIRGQ